MKKKSGGWGNTSLNISVGTFLTFRNISMLTILKYKLLKLTSVQGTHYRKQTETLI